MKKKGFTLIELMIVLAIIAILAVVLIPKSGIFKNQSKNSGVVTNANTVRAYLETKSTNGTGSTTYLDQDGLKTAFTNSFSFGTVSGSGTAADPYELPSTSSSSKELITNPIKNADASIVIAAAEPATADLIAGSVVVVASASNGYTVFGVDDGKNKTQSFTIK